MTKNLIAPVEKLQFYMESSSFEGGTVDSGVLNFLGIFVLRNAVSIEAVEAIKRAIDDPASETSEQDFHPTRVNIGNPQKITKTILAQPRIKAMMDSGVFFAGNVAIENPVIFRKNKIHNKPVMLHNDIDYTAGGATKYSLWVALTTMKPENGGLQMYPGTHNFGSLGDAGEINPAVLPFGYPRFSPVLRPGDVLIMNSGTWHYSTESTEDGDRVLLELKVLNASDPTASQIICGTLEGEWQNRLPPEDLFLSSRSSKIKALYDRVAELEAQLK